MTLNTQEEESVSVHWLRSMAQQLSGVTVVIIIAGGVLTCLLLFIFAKRQIMRFALRSHRGPHVPCGTDASRSLRREIIRRIDALPKITYEPKMLSDDTMCDHSASSSTRPCHYFRMRTLDDTKNLEETILSKKLGKRQSFESLRSYLMVILTHHVDPRIVHQLCDLYEAARFNPKPFNEEEYKTFTQFLNELRNVVATLQPKCHTRSPAKTITSINKTGAAALLQENSSRSVPYVRRVSPKENTSWNSETDESHVMCDSSRIHEVSIIYSNKEDSTAV